MSTGGFRQRLGRVALVLAAVGAAGVAVAPAAAADAPARSLTPFLNCYWDNGDGTVSASIGVTSTNAATVTVPVGTNNMVTQGAANRGQPTSFLPGTRNNVWAWTVSWAEVNNGINWSLTGNGVTVTTANQCSSRPVPEQGSAAGYLGALALVTVVGGIALTGRRSRRREVVTA